ncbi:MAG: MerR family transcriptional regulator [Cytophagaceae bacterium]
MSKYSIKDLERLSGIKAHTIRIWEQRYGITNPDRTDTNIRNYTSLDLKRIINISVLNNHGWKISKIALLSSSQIEQEVKALIDSISESQDVMDGLVMSMIDMDEERFEFLITSAIQSLGFLPAIEKVVYPFFDKIGVLWLTGSISPAQEHFISNLIRQKIIVAIDAIPSVYHNAKGKIIIYLREGELHEIAALIQYYICKQNGYKVFYLGQSVPYEDVVNITKEVKADFLSTIFTTPFPEGQLDDYLKNLSKDVMDTKILLSGPQTNHLTFHLPSHMQVFNSIQDFQYNFK